MGDGRHCQGKSICLRRPALEGLKGRHQRGPDPVSRLTELRPQAGRSLRRPRCRLVLAPGGFDTGDHNGGHRPAEPPADHQRVPLPQVPVTVDECHR
jgi:hypothetical protein